MNAPQLIVADSPESLARRAAELIADAIRADVDARGRCCIALAGGSTPAATYEALAGLSRRSPLPWDRVEFFFGDERAVPPDDPESNYGMARRLLAADSGAAMAQWHRMRAEAPDRDAAAHEYESLLPDEWDILLAGMGDDGHTLSLFPGSPALRDTGRRVLVAESPRPPVGRLTLAPSEFRHSCRTIVLVAGAAKAARLREVLEGPVDPDRFPVQFALGGIWLVDRPSARLLHVPAAAVREEAGA